jgi:Flp pilus assembly protein CpaB
MEASRFKIGKGRPGQPFSSRGGSVLIALIAAVIAGVLIYLFVHHYQKSTPTTTGAPATATVFVAKKYIPAGTPETSIIAGNLLKTEVVPVTQLVPSAISDPSVIAGEVASASIAAGQQVAATDFSHANVTLSSYLTGDHRAIAIAIDAVHGLTSYLTLGSTVDVVGTGSGGSVELFQNITVLGNQAGDVVLDLTDKQALTLTNAEQKQLTIWFELRPLTGATNSVPDLYLAKI